MSDDGTLFGNTYPQFLTDLFDFVIGFVIQMGKITVGKWPGHIYDAWLSIQQSFWDRILLY